MWCKADNVKLIIRKHLFSAAKWNRAEDNPPTAENA